MMARSVKTMAELKRTALKKGAKVTHEDGRRFNAKGTQAEELRPERNLTVVPDVEEPPVAPVAPQVARTEPSPPKEVDGGLMEAVGRQASENRQAMVVALEDNLRQLMSLLSASEEKVDRTVASAMALIETQRKAQARREWVFTVNRSKSGLIETITAKPKG